MMDVDRDDAGGGTEVPAAGGSDAFVHIFGMHG